MAPRYQFNCVAVFACIRPGREDKGFSSPAYILLPLGFSRLLCSPTPRSLYYSLSASLAFRVAQHRARYITPSRLLSPFVFPNTARAILLPLGFSPLSRSPTPRALYYFLSASLPFHVPQHRARYITPSRLLSPFTFPNTARAILLPFGFSRLSRSPTPRALYYSLSAFLAFRVPQHFARYITPSRLLSPFAFPNTARVILLPLGFSRLSRSPTPRTLYYSLSASLAFRVPQHRALYYSLSASLTTLVPQHRARCITPSWLFSPFAFPNTSRAILLPLGFSRLSRSPTPPALYYSLSASLVFRVPQHRARYITPSRLLSPFAFPNTARYITPSRLLSPLSFPNTARAVLLPLGFSRLSRSPTPRALYYSLSASLVFRVPQHLPRYITPSRLLSSFAFPNTARAILLPLGFSRHSRSPTPRALYYSLLAFLAFRVPQHLARYITPSRLLSPFAFPNTSRAVLLPLGLSRLSRSPTPRALYYSLSASLAFRVPRHRARCITPSRPLSPFAFPNTLRPILLPFGFSRLSRSPTPRALYYSLSASLAFRVPRHRAPYITPSRLLSPFAFPNTLRAILLPLGLSRLSRSPTPRALYYSLSASLAFRVPRHRAPYITPSRLLSPFAFPNTARAILLKHLPCRL